MTINGSSETRHTAKCSFQNPLRDAEGIRVVARLMLRTHVFHGSTEASPSRSTHRRRSLGRTTWRFHLDGFRIQCCSFSTDLEGRANFWSPFASGRLQLVLAPPVDNGSIIYNERLILFISLAICCIASIVVVSSCNTHSRTRVKAYPEPSGCRPLTLYRLYQDNNPQLRVSNQLSKLCVPFMTIFTLFTSPWTTSRVCATVIRPSS